MNKTLYRKYRHMKGRCYNPNDKAYKDYGGRGISICDEWLNSYEAFEKWSLSNGFEEGLAIDRIDNDGNYEPENCRFVTAKENNQNRRSSRFFTINGQTKNLQQWCDFYGIERGAVNTRLQNGYSIEEALTKPVKKGKDKTSLIGKRFNHLVVVGYFEDKTPKDTNPRWICKCDCGNTTVVTGTRLKSGHTKSCGCLVSSSARKRMLTNNPMKNRR